MTDTSNAAGKQWYIHLAPETYGPFPIAQLQQYVRDNRVDAQTLVCEAGTETWVKAGDQAALRSLFASAMPAPPAFGQMAATAGGIATQSMSQMQNFAPGNAPSMGFMDAINICLKEKYATFDGRARRAEYWWFLLFTMLLISVIAIVLSGLVAVMGGFESTGGSVSIVGILFGIIGTIAFLALIIPAIAVTVRRLHDLGWSGWWYLAQLIPIVGGLISLAMFIGFMMRGNPGPNKYGNDPLA